MLGARRGLKFLSLGCRFRALGSERHGVARAQDVASTSRVFRCSGFKGSKSGVEASGVGLRADKTTESWIHEKGSICCSVTYGQKPTFTYPEGPNDP